MRLLGAVALAAHVGLAWVEGLRQCKPVPTDVIHPSRRGMRGLEAETSLISSGSAATHKRPITGLT